MLFMQALQVSQQRTLALEEELAAAHKANNALVKRQQAYPRPPPSQVSCSFSSGSLHGGQAAMIVCQMFCCMAAAHGLAASACNVKQCTFSACIQPHLFNVCHTSAIAE